MLLVWAIGLLTALAVTGWQVPAAVQDATPGPGALDFPLDPDPADCRVQPRTVDDLIALWFGPDGSPAALFTDDLARSFGPGPDATEEDARAFLAVPEPAAETEASQIVAIADMMVLADGRVGAFVVDHSPDEGTHVAYAIVERAGDRWLADEVIEFGGEEDESE